MGTDKNYAYKKKQERDQSNPTYGRKSTTGGKISRTSNEHELACCSVDLLSCLQNFFVPIKNGSNRLGESEDEDMLEAVVERVSGRLKKPRQNGMIR